MKTDAKSEYNKWKQKERFKMIKPFFFVVVWGEKEKNGQKQF